MADNKIATRAEVYGGTGRVADIVSALCYSLARERAAQLHDEPPDERALNLLAAQTLDHVEQLPDFMRGPFRAVAATFDLAAWWSNCGSFRRLDDERRRLRLASWRDGRFGVQRDLLRLFDSVVMLAYESNRTAIQTTAPTAVESNSVFNLPKRTEVAVVGSGPGGAVTACLLAEAGREVLLLEEGLDLALESCPPFSREEMIQKYRNAGLTAALGKPKVAYVEGRCVGGGSEINSGLYHRTPGEVLDLWRDGFRLDCSREEDLAEHFAASEYDLNVAALPTRAPEISERLHAGARALGWKSLEVPRWFRFDGRTDADRVATGVRQSMSKSYVPRARNAGCMVASGCRVERIRRIGSRWRLTVRRAGDVQNVEVDTVFVAGGAVQTPALLQRSGVRQNIGRSFDLHPTVKIVAEFAEPINNGDAVVGVHQVKEFSPRISLGCSISTTPYLGIAMLDHRDSAAQLRERASRQAIYYAMVTGAGAGTVRALPGFRDPLVRYRLHDRGLRDLADGLRIVAQCAFAAGATVVYPSVRGMAPLIGADELSTVPTLLPAARTSLMTVHLFSSCPMGEDRSRCAVDSFGKVHEADGLYVCDASILCSAPGVNPQGSIMGFARRNALKFLNRL